MESLEVYWEDQSINQETRSEVYSSLLEGCNSDNGEIDLEEVNDLLSGLDERERIFGDFDNVWRELRVFEVNESPFSSREDIYMLKNEDYAVQVPQRSFDYLIVDMSETEHVNFLPVADVVASIDYEP